MLADLLAFACLAALGGWVFWPELRWLLHI